ncbi:glutathione S-transferase family protein [Methyloceanibacter sp.]|uniref:glutathione S-transferase family protein n=1 Tax=Methyloceanibacter sp. TaxID=1965321 RepID=UPI00208A4E61|nr:glutathione S-transferase family protein [Methyloceanibacter sp.]GFO81807.1 MAG: glutathione S-transferase [Methyloceanibacter sp.]HML91436.1 glutathione S-transferase family protein [Methyloceanibacter sp.]
MANLLHHPLCAFSRSIRLALSECKVEVELNEEKPWEWRPEFLVLNPAGTLPVLLPDDGTPIAGAYAISEWLSDTMDERPLTAFQPFPGDATARAEVRRLVEWFHQKFHEEVTDYLVVEKVFRRFGPHSTSPDMEAMRAGHDNLRYHMTYIGHLTETRSWLAGDAMSFADLAAAAHLSALDYLGEVPWDEFETAKQWYALVKSRPSFRPLLQDRVAGFIPAGTYADLDF